jgi:hypothetical protein
VIKQWRGLLVIVMLALAAIACMKQDPELLNEGQGTRDDPVTARQYAHTTTYDVRAMNAVRPMAVENTPAALDDTTQTEYMRVQYEIKCTLHSEEICNLNDVRAGIKLVGTDGVLYEPMSNIILDDQPLEGEILGGAVQTGWVVYQVPVEVVVTQAVAEYGQDQHVFFNLP